MKFLVILFSVLALSQVSLAGPTQKVSACTPGDYVELAMNVELALSSDEINKNDIDALEYISSVFPQEISGFTCKKIYYIEAMFGAPEDDNEIFELENDEFTFEVVVTTNVIQDKVSRVKVELLEAK